jgi:hypothetical protein
MGETQQQHQSLDSTSVDQGVEVSSATVVPVEQARQHAQSTDDDEQHQQNDSIFVDENNVNNDHSDDNDEVEDDDDDEFYGVGARGEARRRKIEHWKNSPFAVGVVNPTWKLDQPSWWTCCCSSDLPSPARDIDHTFPATSIVCSLLGARRVGNFSVLSQTNENYDEPIQDPATGEVSGYRKKQRPKLLCVVGPYWTVNVFITFPIIFGASGWVCYRRIIGAHIAVIITWSIGTFLLIFSLLMISCRNPGILYRHAQAPPGEENWRWNDQAKTYRPPKARFDPECQAVIHGFDHTCPWTGTVSFFHSQRDCIGSK